MRKFYWVRKPSQTLRSTTWICRLNSVQYHILLSCYYFLKYIPDSQRESLRILVNMTSHCCVTTYRSCIVCKHLICFVWFVWVGEFPKNSTNLFKFMSVSVNYIQSQKRTNSNFNKKHKWTPIFATVKHSCYTEEIGTPYLVKVF